MVAELRELGFLEDQARKALSQSNNNLAVAADILMKPLDNTTTRVRFDESICPDETRLRVPVMSSRGRGRGGFTFTQPPRPGQMYESQTIQTRHPAVSQSVDTHHDQIRDQLPPVLDKLADSLSDLKNTMSTLSAGSTAREFRRVMLERGCQLVAGEMTLQRSLNLMGYVNLVNLMNTGFDQALGPENLGVRCWRAVFP